MRRIAHPALPALVVLLALSAYTRANADAPPMRVEPKVHKGAGWAIAAPSDWGPLRGPPSLIQMLYLVGDGRKGVPLFDGSLSPLKAGLLVERFANIAQEPVKDFVAKDVRRLKVSPEFRLRGEPQTEEMTLSDGTPAVLLRAEFVRVENRRLSIHRKMYCADANGRHVVATGFITCGPAGGAFARAVVVDFLDAHVRSLVLDAGKLDEQGLKRAYDKHKWDAGSALERTDAGNDLLEKDDFPGAARAFREALALCDPVSAAHNGLAWALLHERDAPPANLAEAMREAKTAVEQTEGLDYSALDTLALALHRNGDKEQAVKTIRQALKLRPNHAALMARLRSIEGSGE